MSRFLGLWAAAALAASMATAAHAESVRCAASSSGADWRATAEVTFVDGKRTGTSMQTETWGVAPFPGEDSDYGFNVDMATRREPVGWVSLTMRAQEGQPGRAMLDFASPELIRPGDIVMGNSTDGGFKAQLRLTADGQPVAVRDAVLGASFERFGSGTPNALIARIGGIDTLAADNAQAVMAAARLAKAGEVRVEVLNGGAVALGFPMRRGAWGEAMAARAGLQQKIAAELAAGRCTRN